MLLTKAATSPLKPGIGLCWKLQSLITRSQQIAILNMSNMSATSGKLVEEIASTLTWRAVESSDCCHLSVYHVCTPRCRYCMYDVAYDDRCEWRQPQLTRRYDDLLPDAVPAALVFRLLSQCCRPDALLPEDHHASNAPTVVRFRLLFVYIMFSSRDFYSAEEMAVLFSPPSLFFSVNTITHEPLHLAWWKFALHKHVHWQPLKPIEDQGHRSKVNVTRAFSVFLCVHDTAATRGQYLALSKAWQSCVSFDLWTRRNVSAIANISTLSRYDYFMLWTKLKNFGQKVTYTYLFYNIFQL